MLTSDQAGQTLLADRAYADLRARIVDLRLAPGQLVPEMALAAELGMGRAPVQDALRRLAAEGLVESVPRRGFLVTVPTVEAMREIYEIVAALEGHAVRKAARDAGPILLAALEAAIQEQEAALAAGDGVAWTRADGRYHDLLREAAANRQMRELFRRYEAQLRRVRRATIPFRPRPRRSTDDHRAILEAIRRRDPDEALRVHQAHRERGDAEMLEALRAYVERERP